MGWPYHQKPPLGWPIDSDEPLAQGLVGMWLNQEGATAGGTVQDLSGNGNTGTLVADTHSVLGKFGSALSFDGTGDQVDIVDSAILRITGHLTVSAWVNIGSFTGWDGLVTRWNSAQVDRSWGFHIPNTSSSNVVANTINFIVSPDGAYSADNSVSIPAADLSINAWYHVLARYDGSTIKIFLNGIEKDSYSYSSGLYGDPESVRFANYGGTAANCPCLIDNVLIYNRGLSASEAAQSYYTPFCMFKSPQDIILLNDYSAGATVVPQLQLLRQIWAA